MIHTSYFKHNGFTLMELAIAAGIFVVIGVIVLTNIPNLRRQAGVNAAAGHFIRAIRDARNRSVAIQAFAGTDSYPSYGVFADTVNPDRIVLFAHCKIDNDGPDIDFDGVGDSGDGVIDDNDKFIFISGSLQCIGLDGLVSEIVFDRGVRITEIRRIIPNNPPPLNPPPTIIKQARAHIVYLRPEPSIWITTEGSLPLFPLPPTPLVPFGHIEIDIKDSTNTFVKTIVIGTTGIIEMK